VKADGKVEPEYEVRWMEWRKREQEGARWRRRRWWCRRMEEEEEEEEEGGAVAEGQMTAKEHGGWNWCNCSRRN
jgi:hypothetical protein